MCCGMCQGDLELLGSLGSVDHYRCRACGMTTSIERTENDMHPSITPDRILELAEASMMDAESLGICKACGEEQDGVEPDATGYRCESCGAAAVTGIETLALEVL